MKRSSMRAHSLSRLAPAVHALALAATLLPSPMLAAEVIRVEMKDMAFSPAAFTAHVGDTIEWVNADFVAHTATARDGDWDVNVPAHQTRRLLVQKPGTVAYYCRFHPTMKGEAQIGPP